MADISKITLPSGNTYDLKDATARQMISGGVSFIVAWDGTGTAVAANIPKGVKAGSVTGTLEAADAQSGAFYLVKSSSTPSSETLDIYDEYVVVGSTTKTWEKIGDTQLNLTDVVTGVYFSKQTDVVLGKDTTFTNGTSTVSFSGGTTDTVLGGATTFTNASSSVSFGTPSKDSVLGADTAFSVNKPSVTVSPNTTYLGATANGMAVDANGTADVITDYPFLTTDSFVKSVSVTKGDKLVTTSIIPTDGTETVSKVTKTASKLVTDTVPNITGNTSVTIPNVTGNTTVSIPNVTSAGSASTWSFSMGNGDAAETLIISGANSTAPTLGTKLTATNTTLGTALTATNTTLGTAKTVATGAVASTGTGSDIVTAVSISDKTVAKAGTAVTVATGATDENGTGDAVVSDVVVGNSGSALTALGTPSTAKALTGVRVTTQPIISLTSNATTAAGRVQVVTDVPNPTVGEQTITVGEEDLVDAVTAMPTATAAAQKITVGTNDRVTAVTGIGTGTAAAQKITVGTNDKVTVLKSTTDVSVTKGKQ